MDDQNKGLNERWAPPTGSTERGYAGDEPPTQRTAEIRSEIDRTRADMGETIDEIQDRLRPRTMASRAAESVRDATVNKARQVANTVSGYMPSGSREWRGSGAGYGFVDRVRDNPVPAVLAAASIAWLAFGGRRQPREDMGRAIYGSTRDGKPYIRETRIDVNRESSEGVTDGGGQWAGGTPGESTIERAQHAASYAGERVRSAAYDVRRRGRRMASDSPFAVGAIAAAVGLAIGLALPETERENELMGEARDSVVDRGKETVRNVAERVQNAAGEVQRAAGDALKSVTPPDSTTPPGMTTPPVTRR